MKKYYYECALQALYMQNEFGVKLFLNDADNDDYDFNDYIIEFDYYGYKSQVDISGLRYLLEKSFTDIFVSVESNHIFEPKDWDLKNDQTGEIIMRDGKHFFMPKVIEE